MPICIYTPNRKILDINGDSQLRNTFHENMLAMLQEKKPRAIKNILDLGCSTGLSTVRLHKSFPEANIIGLDLSPYMLSVGKLQLEEPRYLSAKSKIEYVHSIGESTPFSDSSSDLVSICLVSHELPEEASNNIFTEAYRLLRPGGAITFMDMDPNSASFIKLASNPFAYSAFRSTEPWLEQYANMDIFSTLQQAGFSDIEMRSNSPRHRTIVAIKK